MKLEVWTLPGCGRCEDAKVRIRAANLEIIEQDLSAIRHGDPRAADVLTQSTLQNGEAPVIRVVTDVPAAGRGAAFIEPSALPAWLEKNTPES